MTSLLSQHLKGKKKTKKFPDWVSEDNLSMKAVEKIEELKILRLHYINSHNKVSEYKIKKNWQISAGEVARSIGAAKTTLISTSTYSKELKTFLDLANKSLDEAREKKLSVHKRTLQAGIKQKKKEELIDQVQMLRSELNKLRKENVEKQIQEIIKGLSLPVKKKLGFLK